MRPRSPFAALIKTPSLQRHSRASPQSIVTTSKILTGTFTPYRIATTSAESPAPTDIPKLIVSPGSTHHDSLPTFLSYAARKNLAPSKTVYIGTHYEYTVALALLRLGFSLLRVGRRSDAGIDLMGHWVLPPLLEPLPVIVQCKARKIACNPQHIRELEGSFQGVPPDWKARGDVLGLLVTTQVASRGTLEALGRSRWPLGFLKVSRSGTVEQFLWNRAASQRGLEGVGVTVRHTPGDLVKEHLALNDEEHCEELEQGDKKTPCRISTSPAGTKKDIQLTWMGSPISPARDRLDEETMKLMGTMQGKEDIESESDPGKALDNQSIGLDPENKRKVGRPTGSKNKAERAISHGEVRRKPGRPPGAKNKTQGEEQSHR